MDGKMIKNVAKGIYQTLTAIGAEKKDLKQFCEDLLEWGEYFEMPREGNHV
jgi:hypothetical protein